MKSGKIQEWVETVHPAQDRFGLLRIYHRPEEAFWAEMALAYSRRSLKGLTEFRRSKAAVVDTITLSPEAKTYYFKRLLVRRKRWDILKQRLRGSRARRAFIHGETLEACGFGVPTAVCWVEEWRGWRAVQSILITEEVEHAFNLYDRMREPFLDLKKKRRLICAVGKEVGRFHRAGFFHGDMRRSNLLIQQTGDAYRVYWLDNERNKRFRRLPMARRLHNLVRINMEREGLSRTDRLRFWKAYLSEAEILEGQQEELMARVLSKTEKRWRKRELRRCSANYLAPS